MLKSTSIISERNKNLVTASDFWTCWKFSQLLQTDVRAFMEEQAEWIIVFSPPSSLPPSNSPLKCVHYISSACLSTHLSGDKVPRGTWNWANTKKSYFSIQHIHLVVATPHSRAGNAHMNTSATINFSNSFLRCNMSLPSWLSACKHTCRWKKRVVYVLCLPSLWEETPERVYSGRLLCVRPQQAACDYVWQLVFFYFFFFVISLSRLPLWRWMPLSKTYSTQYLVFGSELQEETEVKIVLRPSWKQTRGTC